MGTDPKISVLSCVLETIGNFKKQPKSAKAAVN